MKAYGYNSETGEYTSEVTVRVSPLEPNIALLPANSTIDKPPITKENEIAIWTGKEWCIKQH